MRITLKTALFLGMAFLPIACGGAGEGTAQDPSTLAPPESTSQQADLSPVSEPDGVIALVRWRNPQRVFGLMQQWLGISRDIATKTLRVWDFRDIIDWDAPVGLAVALDENPTGMHPLPALAFSVGLRSQQDALRVIGEKDEIEDLSNGEFRVELKLVNKRFVCNISPALGQSSSRLVCGLDDKGIQALGPYMARGFPMADFPDKDLYGEIRFTPIMARHRDDLATLFRMASSYLSIELGTSDQAVNRAIADAFADLSKEILGFAGDLDKLRFEAHLDQSTKAMSAELGLSLKTRTSWLAESYFSNVGKAGPPHPIFWAAPAESEYVSFGHGSNAEEYATIRRHVRSLLDAWMASLGSQSSSTSTAIPQADRKAMLDLIDKLFDNQPATVLAAGSVQSKVSEGASELEVTYDTVSTTVGWTLIGFEEKHTRFDAFLSELSRAFGRATVQKWIGDWISLGAADMPKTTYGPMQVAGLPGLKAMQISVPATSFDESYKGKTPLIGYVMMLPNGGRTWLAAGVDRAALEKQLRAVKIGGASTIESMSGLDQLRSEQLVSGGFWTLRGMLLSGGSSVPQKSSAPDLITRVSNSPNQGRTPIVWTSKAREGNPSVATLHYQLNSGTMDDIKAIVAPKLPRRVPARRH